MRHTPPYYYTKNQFVSTHAHTTTIFLPRLCSDTYGTRFAMDSMTECAASSAPLLFAIGQTMHLRGLCDANQSMIWGQLHASSDRTVANKTSVLLVAPTWRPLQRRL